MSELILTSEEVIQVTGYTQASRQIRALARAGIRAWRRADGTVVVPRAQLTVPYSYGLQVQAEPLPEPPRPRLHLSSCRGRGRE